jgi:hypothetical protein
MHTRPYGVGKPTACKDVKVRTVHRDRHWRVNDRPYLSSSLSCTDVIYVWLYATLYFFLLKAEISECVISPLLGKTKILWLTLLDTLKVAKLYRRTIYRMDPMTGTEIRYICWTQQGTFHDVCIYMMTEEKTASETLCNWNKKERIWKESNLDPKSHLTKTFILQNLQIRLSKLSPTKPLQQIPIHKKGYVRILHVYKKTFSCYVGEIYSLPEAYMTHTSQYDTPILKREAVKQRKLHQTTSTDFLVTYSHMVNNFEPKAADRLHLLKLPCNRNIRYLLAVSKRHRQLFGSICHIV